MMIGTMPSDQGRARGLYDEQLQRKQQEKALAAGKNILPGGDRPIFRLTAPNLSETRAPAI